MNSTSTRSRDELRSIVGDDVFSQLSGGVADRWAVPLELPLERASSLHTFVDELTYWACLDAIWTRDHHVVTRAAAGPVGYDSRRIGVTLAGGLLTNLDRVDASELLDCDTRTCEREYHTVTRFASADPHDDQRDLAEWLLRDGSIELAPLWLRRSGDPVAFARICLDVVADTHWSSMERLCFACVEARGFADVVRVFTVPEIRQIAEDGDLLHGDSSLMLLRRSLTSDIREIVDELWGSWTGTLGELISSAELASRRPHRAATPGR